MNRFLEFILQEDNNVIEFERMLHNNEINELLVINDNEQGEHLVLVKEVRILEESKDFSPSDEILFESIIILSFTELQDSEDPLHFPPSKKVPVKPDFDEPFGELQISEDPLHFPPSKKIPVKPDFDEPFGADVVTAKSKKDKILEKLKKNVKALERPKNFLLLGELGAGKSSFINSAIMALTGEYDYYANVGSGEWNITTSLCRIGCDTYWDKDDEPNLPTFIDIIGLDPQLSDGSQEDTVNNEIINMVTNGKLPDNCDLLDLSKKLKDGRRLTERNEDRTLAVDAIVVVISAETSYLPHNLISEIYKEANMKKRKIPVFGVLTKLDKCELTENKIEEKKIEVCNALSIIPDKLLTCSNYKRNDKPDEAKDISILEFLITVCNPRFKAITLEKMEFEPSTPAPPVNPPTASNDTSFWVKALQWAFVILVVAFFVSLILQLLSKNKYLK